MIFDEPHPLILLRILRTALSTSAANHETAVIRSESSLPREGSLIAARLVSTLISAVSRAAGAETTALINVETNLAAIRSEEHTTELQSRVDVGCRLVRGRRKRL